MATSAEQTFIRGVAVAEGTRQAAKAAAFVTYGFVLANLGAYVSALSAADVAYFTAVTAALNTAGLSGNTGQSGPISGPWASIQT
jgi:Trk-type K+ transport system membrane component